MDFTRVLPNIDIPSNGKTKIIRKTVYKIDLFSLSHVGKLANVKICTGDDDLTIVTRFRVYNGRQNIAVTSNS